MVERGVAPPTKNIVSQLRTQFPRRKNRVSWPKKDRIEKLKNLVEKIVNEMEVDECKDQSERRIYNQEGLILESLRELQKSIYNDFQAIQIQWEDIVKAASRPKKSTGGGCVS